MTPEVDEKCIGANERIVDENLAESSTSYGSVHDATAIPDDLVVNRWQRYANNFVKFTGAEARGVERIDESLRTTKMTLGEYYNMASVWFSVNLTVSPICPRVLVVW
jgi:hypothetical protein